MLRARLACALVALQCPAVVGLAAARQDEAQRGAQREAESEVEALLRVARTGRVVVRPQAARRLVRRYEAADEAGRAALVARVALEAGETSEDLAALGSALIEVLGALEDEGLRARLWAAVDERDFPWRPYAARSLAETARGDEGARFVALLDDPVAPVRAAAVAGLATLDQRHAAGTLRARLADEDDRVRRAAADLLVDWGEPRALWWLVEELRREDTFFDRPTGEQARFQAQRLLGRHLGALELDPALPPAASAGALAGIEAVVAERAGPRPELPDVARAGGPIAGEALGLEVRSCRRGEFFLRWTEDDELLVGLGRPARVPLAEGTVAGLRERALATAAVVEGRFFGAPGCDLEQLLLRPADAQDARAWIVSKGPEPIADLRPAALGAVLVELLATLPASEHRDPRLDRLRERAAAALVSVGGPVGER